MQIQPIENASNWFFLLAFVGLGLHTDLADLRQTGSTPLLVVLLGLGVTSVLVLAGSWILLSKAFHHAEDDKWQGSGPPSVATTARITVGGAKG
jgi:hypothetical protein